MRVGEVVGRGMFFMDNVSAGVNGDCTATCLTRL